MKNQFVRPVVACLSLSLALVACEKNPVEPPTDEEAQEMVSSLLASLDAGGNASSSSVASGGSTAAPSDSAKQDPKACAFNEATKFFVCPSKTMPNGMTVATSFQLLDASSNPQSKFDAQTSGMRRVTDVTGTLNQPIQTGNGPVPATQTIVQHDDMVVTGFRTSTPEQNGTGTMSNTIAPEGQPSGTVSVSKTVAGLRIDPSPTGPKYPIAGTITSEITSQQGSGPQFTSTQVTTYDGTAIAKTVITQQNGTTRTCTYDMTKKEPPTCS